jgi:SAM-dependent methyltransferase
MKKNPECNNRDCASAINVINSARNFINPSFAVTKAIECGFIKRGQNILEIGSGNLRNSFFIIQNIDKIRISAYEIMRTIHKYASAYNTFRKKGGIILRSFPNGIVYDAIVCTFVLETVCPQAKRTFLLKKIRQSLTSNGILIASFRGVSGVIGLRYLECSKKEGWLTPLHTFIKPYSISEAESLLKSCGFTKIVFLQDYRVDTPKNIHLVAV